MNKQTFTAQENDWLSALTTNDDGTQLIVFRGTGRRVLVPRGIRLFYPSDDFYGLIVDAVSRAFAHAIPTSLAHANGKRGDSYHILITRYKKRLWVAASGPHSVFDVVAEFREYPDYIQEVRAAAHPSAQGQGVYKHILRAMRRRLLKPLQSDKVLSPPNILVWMSQQAKPTGAGFRMNPRERIPAAAIQAALRLAFDEVALRERIVP